ncbi:hypothetical protein D3C78_1509370 [compost metagenome]
MRQPLASRFTCDSNVDGRCVTRPATGEMATGTSSSTTISVGARSGVSSTDFTIRKRPCAWPVFSGKNVCSRSNASCVTKASPAVCAVCSCAVEFALKRTGS